MEDPHPPLPAFVLQGKPRSRPAAVVLAVEAGARTPGTTRSSFGRVPGGRRRTSLTEREKAPPRDGERLSGARLHAYGPAIAGRNRSAALDTWSQSRTELFHKFPELIFICARHR